MPRLLLLLLALLLALASGGACTPMQHAASEADSEGRVAVFVDDKLRALTPTTLIVRRSFGVQQVILRQHNRVVRTFEIKLFHTWHRTMLDYSFSGYVSGGRLHYNVQDLPRSCDSSYVIPYYRAPIEIEDRQHYLTLIVED